MAREAIQALDKILQFNYQRDRAKVQETLQFMQFAEQKRQNDINVFNQQLETIGKANEQMKSKVANDFIVNAKLMDAYNAIGEKPEDLTKAIGLLKDSGKGVKKGTDFNEKNASSIASAMWAMKFGKNYDMMVNLSNSLNNLTAEGYKFKDKNEKNMMASLNTLNTLYKYDKKQRKNVFDQDNALIQTFKQSKSIKDNANNILKEQFQLATGDTEITSNFGIFGLEAAEEFNKDKKKKGQPGEEDISKAADQYMAMNPDLTTDLDGEPDEGDYEEGSPYLRGTAAVGTGWLAGYFWNKHTDQLTDAEKRLKADYEKHRMDARGNKNPEALSRKAFKEKYGMDKPKVSPRKGFVPKKVGERIKEMAYKETSVGKGTEKVKGMAKSTRDLLAKGYGKKGVLLKGALSKPSLTLAPAWMGSLGEAVGGFFGDEETGEQVGRGAGIGALAYSQREGTVYRAIRNFSKRKGGQTFIQFLTKRVPKIGAKVGAIAMADSPAFGPGDIAALGLGATELYGLLKEWNSLEE